MTKTKIEWADYTWNPVVGCTHNCWYCYAKELNNRFKFIPNWNEPQFFPERLTEPSRLRKQSKIFVGSMCDMMGEKVKYDWIQKVIYECILNPQHQFMWLTKNPTRYKQFIFPNNCWLGMTLTKPSVNYWKFRDIVKEKNVKSFISIEPIIDSFKNMKLSDMDLVIVGAMTGKKAIETPKEWIQSVKHHNIFYKDSALKILEKLP